MSRKNVFSTIKEKKRKKNIQTFAVFFAGFFFLFVFLIGIANLREFKIKKISIEGNATINGEKITENVLSSLGEKWLGFVPRDNIFIFPAERLAADLSESFPRIKEVEVSRDFPDSILVKITERKQAALFCDNDSNAGDAVKKCFFLDENGTAFEPAPFFSGDIYLKFFNEREEKLSLGDTTSSLEVVSPSMSIAPTLPRQIFPKTLFKKIIDFSIALNKENLRTTKIVFKGEKIYEVHFIGGWYVLLSEDGSPELALENLKIAIINQIGDKRSSLEYIDLRLDNKVYYKYK